MELEEAKRRAISIWVDDDDHMSHEQTESRILAALPHYLFTIGDPKHRQGFCTACNTWVDCGTDRLPAAWVANDPYLDDDPYAANGETPPFEPMWKPEWYKTSKWRYLPDREKFGAGNNHLDIGYCPECGGLVQFRGLNRGRKQMTDGIFFIRYAKDALDPENSVVCLGYSVYVPWKNMDEMENLPPVPLRVNVRELCVFQYGKGGRRWTHQCEWNEEQKRVISILKRRRECKSGYRPGGLCGNGPRMVLDLDSLMEAVEGTPFQRVLQENDIQTSYGWGYIDRITLMNKVASYPCIEYLCKLDMGSIVGEIIDGKLGNVLNLQGKTAQSVLRLTPEQWGTIKGKQLRLCKESLRLLHLARKDKSLHLSPELCCEIGQWGEHENEAVHRLIKEHRNIPPAKALKYCARRRVRVRDYVDYLEQMETLSMPYTDKTMLYPKDFNTMHTRLSERIATLKIFKEDSRIGKRLKELDEYTFSAYGLILRPFVSAAEVIREGTELHHCVGGYVNGYASGNNVLCALREETAPNLPLYTVEFGKDGRLIQCRGYRNDYGEEGRVRRARDQERLDRFWHLFELMRADYKAQQKRKKKKEKAA